jgi:murein L,D-transpeptidase YcbB/YkuD
MLFFVISILTGCSTAQKPMSYNNLYVRLERIEGDLEQKTSEIEDMQYSLQDLDQRVDKISARTEDSAATGIRPDGYSADAQMMPVKEDGTIRVPVSAKEVQIGLKNAGYYNGPIDGKIGNQSLKAIKDFQKDFNLKVDGIIGRETWGAIKPYLE